MCIIIIQFIGQMKEFFFFFFFLIRADEGDNLEELPQYQAYFGFNQHRKI